MSSSSSPVSKAIQNTSISSSPDEIVVPLSKLASEIRSYCLELQKEYDDYTCLTKWISRGGSNGVSYWIEPHKLEVPSGEQITETLAQWLQSKFVKRAKVINEYTKRANEAFTDLKGRLVKQLELFPEVKKMGGAASSGIPSFMNILNDMDSMYSAMNLYYKLQTEVKEPANKAEGLRYMNKLSVIMLEAICAISKGEVIPLEKYASEVPVINTQLHQMTLLFSLMDTKEREEINKIVFKFMHMVMSCFVLYRFPVHVVDGHKPVYISRCFGGVVLGPYLERFEVKQASLVM
jgi:hypothetical protein